MFQRLRTRLGPRPSEHFVVRSAKDFVFNKALGSKLNLAAFSFLVLVAVKALFGPQLAPYEYDALQTSEDGQLNRLAPPSADHPLGTTYRGEDVLSRILYGSRATATAGFLGGLMIAGIGTTVGLLSGYLGGPVDRVLMRVTDFAYGVPLIPFAIALVVFLGVGLYTTIFVIGIVLWRGLARVIRAQVLQIKERPYIQAARATGASTTRIMVTHILPNIGGMIVLFFALGIGSAILVQANLAFIGVSDPFLPAWGVMIRSAYSTGNMLNAWWWSLPPGILITLTVMSAFIMGRSYEVTAEADAYES